jgi:hypothetical protein
MATRFGQKPLEKPRNVEATEVAAPATTEGRHRVQPAALMGIAFENGAWIALRLTPDYADPFREAVARKTSSL